MVNRFRGNALALAIAAAGLNGFSTGALAQSSGLVLQEVIVTATKQEESLSDVPVSVMALGSERIDQLGFRDLGGLVASVPNVNIMQGGSGTQLTIRGIGSPPTGGVSSSVATIIDGVYQANSRSTNNILFDMQRVEVLRGPQGTLFGKNAIAGVFNLLSARPTDSFEGLIDARVGNDNSHEGTAVISGGLTDTLSARFAAFNKRTGNYLDNTVSGADAGGTDTEAYRLSLNWAATDNTNIWFKWQHDSQTTYTGGARQVVAIDPIDQALFDGDGLYVDSKLDGRIAMANGVTRTGLVTGFGDERYNDVSRDIFALTLEHEFDNGYAVNATAGYDKNDVKAVGSLSATLPYPTIYGDSTNEFESKNLEVRLVSPQDERFRFSLGAYGEKSEDEITKGRQFINWDSMIPTLNYYAGLAGATVAPSDLAQARALMMENRAPNGGTEVSSWAVFGEATYEFNDEWQATFGLRYARDSIDSVRSFSSRYDFDGNPFGSMASIVAMMPNAGAMNQAIYQGVYNMLFFGGPFTVDMPPVTSPAFDRTHDDKALLPAGRLEYRPDADSLYYFSVQTGYKNGGFSTDTLSMPTPFDKERSLAFELGAKLGFADGRGQFNAAIFRTNFKDLQVGITDPYTGTVGFDNAAEAVSQGIELGAQYQLTETLTISGNYGYLDAEYDSFDNAPCTVSAQIAAQTATNATGQNVSCGVQDLAGERLNFAPENTASVALDYNQPLWGAVVLSANLTVSYTDDFHTEVSNSKQLDADKATLVDARIGLSDEDKGWTVALIGQNLTDDDGNINGGPAGLGASKGTYTGQMRPPASYWLQISQRF